jgi:hypothetical protein
VEAHRQHPARPAHAHITTSLGSSQDPFLTRRMRLPHCMQSQQAFRAAQSCPAWHGDTNLLPLLLLNPPHQDFPNIPYLSCSICIKRTCCIQWAEKASNLQQVCSLSRSTSRGGM